MKIKKIKRKIRIWHRYLGIIIGVQFIFWTLGGLYFSWTNISEIRGKDIFDSKNVNYISLNVLSPNFIIESLSDNYFISDIKLKKIIAREYYIVNATDKSNHKTEVFLYDAISGNPKTDFSINEAEKIVNSMFLDPVKISKVETVTNNNVNKHHEIRNKNLPVYAVELDKRFNPTVYVSMREGEILAVRNNQWRIFDFLWMLHTMDYVGRDNFNNLLLRLFSLLGLITLLSGFTLFFFSMKKSKEK